MPAGGGGRAGGAALQAMMGKEEEIARIARRLDKMVTKKSAVRGAGRQDPGTPVPPSPRRAAEPVGPGDQPRARRDPGPADTPGRGETRRGSRPLPSRPAPSAEATIGLDLVPAAARPGLGPADRGPPPGPPCPNPCPRPAPPGLADAAGQPLVSACPARPAPLSPPGAPRPARGQEFGE